MRTWSSPAAGLLLALWLSLAPCLAATPTTGPLPDGGEVIRRFVEHAALLSSNQVAGSYIFYRTNITEEYTRKGTVAEREELLLRVTVAADDKQVELVAIDGRAPTDKERERELKRFSERRAGAGKRERPDRSRPLDAYLTMEILSRYLFTVEGREEVAGRTCLKVSFKPGVIETKSDKLFDRVLDKLKGTFWIDEEDYLLAKADFQLGEKVSLWGGFLGALEQMRLQIERTRDASGLWRDQAVEARFVGRAVTKHIDVRTWDLSSVPQPNESAAAVAAP